jgi:membrane-bound serine protease (ClpP class)
MNPLVNENIAYLLLMFGSIFVMMALVTPGTHLMEGAALLFLAAAGFEIFYLGFNTWALIVLVVGLVPFIYSIRKPKREWALVLSILALIIGSLYLFPGKGWLPAVNPVLAVVISALTAGFLWLAVRKGVLAHNAVPLQDLKSLVDQVGYAKTTVHQDGTVQVASELWSARSAEPIPAGSRIRVVRREGFTLVVAPDDQPNKNLS